MNLYVLSKASKLIPIVNEKIRLNITETENFLDTLDLVLGYTYGIEG